MVQEMAGFLHARRLLLDLVPGLSSKDPKHQYKMTASANVAEQPGLEREGPVDVRSLAVARMPKNGQPFRPGPSADTAPASGWGLR